MWIRHRCKVISLKGLSIVIRVLYFWWIIAKILSNKMSLLQLVRLISHLKSMPVKHICSELIQLIHKYRYCHTQHTLHTHKMYCGKATYFTQMLKVFKHHLQYIVSEQRLTIPFNTQHSRFPRILCSFIECKHKISIIYYTGRIVTYFYLIIVLLLWLLYWTKRERTFCKQSKSSNK